MNLQFNDMCVATITYGLDDEIISVITDEDAYMYNENGNGIYNIENIKNEFSEDSNAYKQLLVLEKNGFDFFEY